MEFNDKLFRLRKQKGLSQEELANRLNVSFEISLDELVLDKIPAQAGETAAKSEILGKLKQKVLTDENRKKAKRGFKIAAIIIGILVAIDVISMIVYFGFYGFLQ